MKQPLRETLKRIGGGHLLNENKDMIMYYSDALGNYIKQLRPTIKGWKFSIDHILVLGNGLIVNLRMLFMLLGVGKEKIKFLCNQVMEKIWEQLN